MTKTVEVTTLHKQLSESHDREERQRHLKNAAHSKKRIFQDECETKNARIRELEEHLAEERAQRNYYESRVEEVQAKRCKAEEFKNIAERQCRAAGKAAT